MNNHYENFSVDKLYAEVWGDGIHFGTYPSGTELIEDAARATRNRMMDAVGLAGVRLVLEVGSGHGVSARHLARRVDGRIIATNHARNHNEIAAKYTLKEGMGNRVCHGLADFHTLPFFENMFDLYWCQESFVHATDKPQVMAEAFRVLAPGGAIVFSDQTTNRLECLPDERDRIAQRHGVADLCDADDFTDLLRAAGFDVEAVHDWSPHMTRHFENLVQRIEQRWDELAMSIDTAVLRSNYDNWCTAAAYARRGKMGWFCFVARKPQ